MSKAWHCLSHGSPRTLTLADLSVDDLSDDKVRVDIHAIGINFLDLLMIEGMPGLSPTLPFIPGIEAAGIVASVGASVSGITPGQHVFLMPSVGAYAESIDLTPDRLILIPPDLDFVRVAATGICFGTSQYALCRRGDLTKHSTVAVLGATGATGLAAVTYAASRGAKVIAVGSNSAKLEVARTAGAQQIINYTYESVADNLRKFTDNHGVDIIFDTVAGLLLQDALDGLRTEGKVICIGATSGGASALDHMTIVTRNIDAVGISFGFFRQDEQVAWQHAMTTLFDKLHRGSLSEPPFHIYDFDEAPTALTDLKSRKLCGKSVIRVK